jgi:hypothetical protein
MLIQQNMLSDFLVLSMLECQSKSCVQNLKLNQETFLVWKEFMYEVYFTILAHSVHIVGDIIKFIFIFCGEGNINASCLRENNKCEWKRFRCFKTKLS